MICPKCGEEYEDDMQCCLWCDAPNPNYGRVVEAECKVGSVQKRNQGEINGFDYLEHSDEVDFAQRTSGFVVFKIADESSSIYCKPNANRYPICVKFTKG